MKIVLSADQVVSCIPSCSYITDMDELVDNLNVLIESLLARYREACKAGGGASSGEAPPK